MAEMEMMTFRQLAEWIAKGNGQVCSGACAGTCPVPASADCVGVCGGNCARTAFGYDEIEKKDNKPVPLYYKVRRWGDDEWISPSYKIYKEDCLCLKDSNKDEKQIFNDGYGKGYRAAMTNVNLVVKGTENGFDLNEVAKTAYEIARKRAESGKIESPNDTLEMLKHCAGEVVEAMDAYNYFFYSEDLDNGLEKLASEFADIIICCLISCAYHGIDIEEAIEEAIKKNLERAEGIGDKK